jgi:hypothetical protein
MKKAVLLLTAAALAGWAAAAWGRTNRVAVAPTAYAFVTANGTLWSAQTNGVTGIKHPARGLYCFRLATPANNAVGSVNPGTVAGTAVVMPFLPGGPSGGVSLSGCPSGYQGASALVSRGSGVPVNAGFYIVFTS